MTIALSTPFVDRLGDVVGALRTWQRDDAPVQLHPGDLGWVWRNGAEATAATVRTWADGDRPVAIGFLDGPDVFRMTVAPEVWRDDQLARRVVQDLGEPDRGVLPAGRVSVEAPDGSRVQEVLDETGWVAAEAWTPLSRDLREPVEVVGLRVGVVDAGNLADFTAVHRSAWESTRFTDEVWRTMASGSAFEDARCLLGRDDDGIAVAGVTVWGAGPGRPGLLEPLGIHADHRGRGFGREMVLAAAAELRSMGASSAMVCTESARTAAVATYRSAGFRQHPDRLDRTRRLVERPRRGASDSS
ncbi:N-acetyltransferase [Cellulomonas sp. HZM]|uniref:GNAT family N-acetyltransferase n=1 Tax=Cellulomonas sp. HZM TaxID=1454010 RepID=UPI000690FB50|nr:GNAT family N-acetyltransferase [Cellulomonas sp. HZM]